MLDTDNQVVTLPGVPKDKIFLIDFTGIENMMFRHNLTFTETLERYPQFAAMLKNVQPNKPLDEPCKTR